MAVTQNTYTGNGSTVLYSFTFPYLETTDIKVSLNGVNTTAYTLANPTTVQFNSAPANGVAIRIYRQTDDAGTKATFFPGSAIRSQDLNDNFLQVLYKSQETETFAASTDASAIQATANLALSTANNAITSSNAAVSTANGIAGTANTALSNSSTALSTANAALPKAGGTMTGDIVFNGTQTFPNSGLQLASTSQQGIVQLTNSTSSTSTTTAATPNAVKSAFDLANAALPLTGGTLTGNLIVPSLNGGPLSGARNRIINGDMRIDQRNAGASVTPAGTIYTIDRWQLGITQASRISIARQATSGFGFTNYALLTIASTATVGSTDFFQLTQSIEGLNVSDLEWGTANAKSVTLSFWGYSSVSGTYGGVLKNGGGTRSYPFTYTLPAASWTYISITVPGVTTGTWATDNTTGIQLGFSLGMGSTYSGPAGAWASANYGSATGATSLMGTSGATFALTGVQLEPGSVATPFERRSYGQELALCQRYAYAWGLAGHQLAAAYTTGLYSDANQITMHPLGVNISQMRAIPTNITLIGTQGTDWAVQTASGVNQTGFSIATNIGAITANKASHGLVGNAANLQVLNSNGRIIISSEL